MAPLKTSKPVDELTPEEVRSLFQEPFPAEDVEWRVGSTNGDKTRGLALAYITNRAIQNRLDEVCGPFGWRNEFREWRGNSQICGISVKYRGEWITKWDGADDSQTEATKGGLSDAMKRAGYQWGIGRYLYNLDSQWVALEPMGKSYKIKGEPPKLPAWALPKGTTQKPVTPALQPAPEPAPVPATAYNLATEQQRKRMFAMCKQLSWDAETIKRFVSENTGKTSSKELTQTDIQNLFTMLEELVKAKGVA